MDNPSRSRGLLCGAARVRCRVPGSRAAWYVAACLLGSLCAYARPTAVRVAPVPSPFEHAERLHAALEEQPQEQRTRGDYERVLDAYRLIYHENPASAKADASISAVAELLAEQGRLFHSEKSLHDAIAQYEFLRHDYPVSRYRFSALLAEGEIYRADLGQPEQAKAAFQEFLKSYPRHPLAEQARAELKEIREQQNSEKHKGRRQVQLSDYAEVQPATAGSDAHSAAAPGPEANGDTTAETSRKIHPQRAAAEAPQRSQPDEDSGETSLPAPVAMSADLDSGRDSEMDPDLESPSAHSRRRPRVTEIRDWSTSDSTRIAINLDAQVQYEEARVAHPDRIYFDLRNTHLSPELAGKSIMVTDGGFLKRIRAAQYSDGVTRIVLDVNAGTDCSAFFLPNPWRLIIDIHGRKAGASAAKDVATLDSAAAPTSTSINATSARQAGGGTGGTDQGFTPKTSRTRIAQNGGAHNELEALAAPLPVSASGIPRNAQQPGQQQLVPVGVGQVRRAKSVSSGYSNNSGPASGFGSSSSSTSGLATQVASPKDLVADNAGLQPGDELNANPYPSVASTRQPRSPAPMDAPATRETQSAGDGDRSLSRTLGLKIGRIVIDAGHGGHDSGTLGPEGIQEKDVTLDVSLRLGKLLKRRLGADVIYTRDDDTFIPLETRTAIANRSHADLFISVHANSSPDPTARGVESYYLNFTTSPEALEVAARENSVSDESIYQLSDLVKKITLRDKIEESREFAADVQQSLYNGLEAGNPGLKDRGVKKAPFMVLIGANMPSILAEISFLTNPDDARELRQPAYRQRIAEALYRGVAKYINGLNGIRLAQNGGHPGN